MPSGQVVLLTGLKGAGKTHIGEVLARIDGVTFLRVEPLWLRWRSEEDSEAPGFEAEGYRRVAAEVTRILEREGTHTVVIESTAAAPSFSGFLEELQARHRVRLVRVTSDPHRCIRRVGQRDRSIHIDVSDDRLREINQAAALVDLPWEMEFDNDGDPDEAHIVHAFEAILDSPGPRRAPPPAPGHGAQEA
jgi:hypothetical protein